MAPRWREKIKVIIHLDTNIASGIIRRRKPIFRQNLIDARNDGHEIYISIIVYSELLFGALNSPIPVERSQVLADFVRSISGVVEFKLGDAKQLAKLRAHFKPRGNAIGPYDFLIAAQALAYGAHLVTANLKEFKRVPDLNLVSWK